MSDSDSLVDDPHEGWVIPYDQAEDISKPQTRHVSIAGQTNKPAATRGRGDTDPLSQNMEDTRL